MSIRLNPCEGNAKIYSFVLNRESYRLSFDIGQEAAITHLNSVPISEMKDLSISQPDQIFDKNSNIKDRVKSLCINPWAYGQSYINPIQPVKRRTSLI